MRVATPDRLVSEALQDIARELTVRLEDVAGQRMNFSLLVFHSEPGSLKLAVSPY